MVAPPPARGRTRRGGGGVRPAVLAEHARPGAQVRAADGARASRGARPTSRRRAPGARRAARPPVSRRNTRRRVTLPPSTWRKKAWCATVGRMPARSRRSTRSTSYLTAPFGHRRLHPGSGALRASPPDWTAATATQGSSAVATTVASQSSPRHASAAATVPSSRRATQSRAAQP